MITAAADFFGTLMGKFALGGGIIATIFGWLLIHDHRVRVQERQAIEEGAKALNAKGLQARASVRTDGASERLRRQYCSDCK
jgi:hypothetical protein